MMTRNKPISVVGAGPAGLTAAIILANNGYNVNLYERNNDVGLRFKGDFQGLENWSDKVDTLEFLNGMGIKINFLCRPFGGNEGMFFGPKLNKIQVKTSRPLFYLIERGSGENSFDQGLRKQAEDAGVNILWGQKLEKIKSHYTIVGAGPKAADAIAKGIIFETSFEDTFIGFLDNKIAPHAYAYLIVNNGKATFATCLFKDFKNANVYYQRALQTLNSVIDIDINSAEEFGGYINFFTEPVISRNKRILYVGENSGFQDALWGFGIKYAMLSGFNAAQSIIYGYDYNKLCERNIYPKLKTSFVNRYMFSHLYNPGYNWILNKMRKKDDIIPVLYKYYNSSIAKKIFYTISKKRYRSKLIDQRCLNENCNCVWCKHGKLAHDQLLCS